MSDDAPPDAARAVSNSNNTSDDAGAALPTGFGGDSIAKVLQSKGPVVTCVLLRHMGSTGKDTKPHPVISKKAAETAAAALNLDGSKLTVPAAATAAAAKDAGAASNKKGSPTPPPSPRPPHHHHHHHHHREVLTELIEEIQVDTTPSAQGVPKALGGPFSFIGQYADEGVVLMKRADQLDDLDELNDFSVKQLVALCQHSPDIDYDAKTMLEKSDLVYALRAAQLPVNPHKLQPPFDREVVRGDILVLRVAADDDDKDEADEDTEENPDEAMAKALADFKNMTNVSNEDFFLNYTKEEWVAFAARTDVVAPKIEALEDEEAEGDEEEEDDDEEEEEESDDDDDFEVGDDDELDEKDKPALLNLLLGQVIKKFRENNGRGPDSEELLALRREVAGKLGIQLEESVVAKRPAEDDGEKDEHEHSPKKVKFTGEVDGAGASVPAEADDAKPAASSANEGDDGDKKESAD